MGGDQRPRPRLELRGIAGVVHMRMGDDDQLDIPKPQAMLMEHLFIVGGK